MSETPTGTEAKLLPCPFCGKPPEVTTQGEFKKVMCENVTCPIIVETFNRPECDSIEQWNARAPSELEMLRAEVQAAKNRDAYRENLVTELRNERSVLREENKKQEAELARLRAVIEGAPHEPGCCHSDEMYKRDGFWITPRCTCFKSQLNPQ